MSDKPLRIDTVTDTENHETVGIAPVDAKMLKTEDPNSLSVEAIDRIGAIILAVVLVTIAMGLHRVLM